MTYVPQEILGLILSVILLLLFLKTVYPLFDMSAYFRQEIQEMMLSIFLLILFMPVHWLLWIEVRMQQHLRKFKPNERRGFTEKICEWVNIDFDRRIEFKPFEP